MKQTARIFVAYVILGSPYQTYRKVSSGSDKFDNVQQYKDDSSI